MAAVVVAQQGPKGSAGLRLVLSEESTPEAQLVERLQAESGPALLVASDAAMVERWREQLQPWPEELEARVVWLGACAEEAAWHSYNDPRCNGSKPLQHWQPLYPNLQLQQVEIKLRQPLTELLAHWQQQPEGLVLLQGERGSAAGVLAGLDASSALVAHLELTGCGELSSAVMDELDQQLWEQGALQRREAQLIWERNEEEAFRRTVLNERDALVNERDALVNERDALVNERDALVNERDALVNERDALVNERDALVNERDALVNERDALVNERDALVNERDALVNERDALVNERDALVNERDALVNERDALVNERDALVNERDALVNERDALVNERDALVNERDALVHERDALVHERDALVHERDALVHERDALVHERDALMNRIADCDGRMERINTELDEILALIDSASNGEPTDT